VSFWGHSHCSYESWASFSSGTGSCKLSRGRYYLIIFSTELINFFQSGITLPSIKCSENRLGSTVPFCLFDKVLNVISIKDIDNGCKLKTRDLIFLHNFLQIVERTLLLKRFCLFQLVRFQHNCFTMMAQCAKPKSNNIFTRTNQLFPVRNNPTFNQMQWKQTWIDGPVLPFW
jgi:hypothetical protein